MIQGNGSLVERDANLFTAPDRCSGTTNFRIIHVFSGGTLTLEDVTIQNGCAIGAVSGGGGIRNNGITTLTRCTVRDNAGVDFSGGEGPVGGGIYNTGFLVEFSKRTVNHNSAFDGGALFIHDSTVNIKFCMFIQNKASNRGGVINIRDFRR